MRKRERRVESKKRILIKGLVMKKKLLRKVKSKWKKELNRKR